MESPVIVIGCARSGTSFLSSLLRGTIFGEPVESHFITKYYKMLNRYSDISKKLNFVSLISDILSERAVLQWDLEINVETFYEELDTVSYRRVVDAICMKRPDRVGEQSYGEKTPNYIFDLDIIYELFPDSKYIYIVRDGRDVALSLIPQIWGPNNTYSAALYWKSANEQHIHIIDKLREMNQLFDLKYEKLLIDPKSTLSSLYKFLDEKCDSEGIDKLVENVKANNFNKWKMQMTENQIRLFEQIAANTLNRLGYPTTYKESRVNDLTRLWYETHNYIERIKFHFGVNVIDSFKIKYFGKKPFAE